MIGRSVLVHTPDALGANRVVRALRAAGCDVAVSDRVAATVELLASATVDLLLLDHRDDGSLQPLVGAANGDQIPVVVISAAPEPAALLDQLRAWQVLNLIAASTAEPEPLRSIDPREVAVTCAKLLGGDLFGIDKYLPSFAVDLSRRQLAGEADRDVVVARVSTYLESLDVAPPMAASLTLMADELAANALRHGASPVELSYGSDGNIFAVAVRDGGGLLTPEAIGNAMDLTDQASGMGLLAALHACSQLIFNLSPGHATEVIAVADLRARSALARAGRSVHLFVDGARIDRAAAPARTVELSPSMRLDVRHQLAAVATVPMPQPDRDRTADGSGPLRPRRRPRATPNPLNDLYQAGMGLDTLRGVLRGTSSEAIALESALRFLANDCQAAVAYRIDHETLVPVLAAGHVDRWFQLGRVEPWLRAPSTLAVVARDRSMRAFAVNKRGLDRRIAGLVGIAASATTWALPIVVDDQVRYVLAIFAPNLDRVLLVRVLLELRGELEDALERLAGGSMVDSGDYLRAPTVRRAATEPPYAELQLLYGRAATDSPYLEIEVSHPRLSV